MGEPGTVFNVSKQCALLLSQDLAQKSLPVEPSPRLAFSADVQPSSVIGLGIRLGSLFSRFICVI